MYKIYKVKDFQYTHKNFHEKLKKKIAVNFYKILSTKNMKHYLTCPERKREFYKSATNLLLPASVLRKK